MVKRQGALYPADEDAEALMRRLKAGEMVSVEIHRPRNVRFQAKFFCMLRIVYQNQDAYPSMDVLLSVCKLETGHFDVKMVDGKEVWTPKSISFASMDDFSFGLFYNAACKWVCEEVIPGLDRGNLDEQVRNQLQAFGTPEG